MKKGIVRKVQKKKAAADKNPEKKLINFIIDVAQSKKGENISLINLTGIFPLADYFIIVTGKNLPHIKALYDVIKEEVAQKFGQRAKREGIPESRWLILDYGNVIVHIIGAREREFYSLEKLWAQAPVTHHY